MTLIRRRFLSLAGAALAAPAVVAAVVVAEPIRTARCASS